MSNEHSQKNTSTMSPNILNQRGSASEGFSPTDTVRCRAECAQTGSARREILQRCSRRGNKRERMREREGKDRSQGRGCMFSWSPQSTVRGRMARIEGKLGHVEKYSCNDPSSIICLPPCTASSSHLPSKPANV